MKFITDIAELEGKTIQKATNLGYDDPVVLIFNDNTCAAFEAKFFHDSYEICLADDVSNEVKRDAGIITMDEYKAIQQKELEEMADKTVRRELEMLKKLKDKYEK